MNLFDYTYQNNVHVINLSLLTPIIFKAVAASNDLTIISEVGSKQKQQVVMTSYPWINDETVH